MGSKMQILIVITGFLIFFVGGVFAEDKDVSMRIDMLVNEGKLKFENGCILATSDKVFCSCLSEEVGSGLIDEFGLYVDGMSNNAEKRNHVRGMINEFLKGTNASAEQLFNKWVAAREACRKMSIMANQPIKPTR